MSRFFARFPPLKTLKLRPKLILAFAGMAVMGGLCGIMGLVFVDRIGATVSVFSDVTSPLLRETMVLVDNAQRMRSVFLRAVADGEGTNQVSQRLFQLEAANRSHMQALRDLAARVQVDVRIETIKQREREFVQTLNDMAAAYGREQKAAQVTKERLADFEAKHQEFAAVLVALANRAEGKITTSEEEAKVQVQTGAATVDGLGDLISDVLTETYPVLASTNKVMHEIEQIDEAVKLVMAQVNLADVSVIEQEAKSTFRSINSASKKLAGRLRDPDGKAEIAAIQQRLADLDAAVLGAAGLFAGQRESLAASAEIATGRASLVRNEAMYVVILNEVQRAVDRLNQDARDRATIGILEARTVIAGGALLTLLASLAFAFFFAHRITGPLTRLTDHAVAIRTSGELNALSDASTTGRADEIGMLSRSFNLMIAELADARRRLVAWSEAEIRMQYERLNAAINNMPQGLCMFDAEQKLIVCNSRYAELYGLTPEETIPGIPLRTLLEHRVANGTYSENSQDYVEKRLAAALAREPFYFVNELADGHTVAISYQPMRDGGCVATHEDITERRKAEAQIAYMAHHDALTELPNRVRFREDMTKALSRVERGETLAVLCIDLDHFKTVNDTLGHPVGDALLQAASDRLRACVRPNDIVARLGGDEFAVVQVGSDQPVGSTALATRLVKEIGQPFNVCGHQVVIGASVGIAIAPNDGKDPDLLLKGADLALYRAKEDGRGIFRFFEPDMDAKMQARRALELDLRRALVLTEFELFYQPIINLERNEVVAFEALLRWRHPQRGLVSPAEFIPITEEIGLINPIGAWALKQACIEAASWPDPIRVAVNLSPVQFKSGTVVLDVAAALGASGLSAHRLELEITETVLLQDTEATVSTLNQLRALGTRISMDDFGTGYSSLAYLRKFPFDKIKIDRSFINDLVDGADSIAIIRAVTGLGSSLGITTTAEGVETKEQLHLLRDEGCTEVQGYYFSKPKPASEIEALLHRTEIKTKTVA